MEELLKAYFDSVGHYLSPVTVLQYREVIRDGEYLWEADVENLCLNVGRETICVSVSDLLVFLYKRGAA